MSSTMCRACAINLLTWCFPSSAHDATDTCRGGRHFAQSCLPARASRVGGGLRQLHQQRERAFSGPAYIRDVTKGVVKWAYKAAWLRGMGRARGTLSRARSRHEIGSNTFSSDREDTQRRVDPDVRAPGFRSGRHTAQCGREVEFNDGLSENTP